MVMDFIKDRLREVMKPTIIFEQKFASKYLSAPNGTLLDFNSEIKHTQDGNDELYKLLKLGNPLMATRFGNVELYVVMNYLQSYYSKRRWHPNVISSAFKLDGIFPANKKTLEKLSKLYLEEIKKIDILGVWHNKGEEELHQKYFPNAQLVDLVSYESFFYNDPWSKVLKHKKVLVIHPYAASIKAQYLKRDKIFLNPNILPEFDLKTLKPFHSIIDKVVSNRSWFDELDTMKEKISKEDFEIALIAAGPFGLPLAGFIKSFGKQAVHIGGALQLFFGIKGQRWEQKGYTVCFNEHWIRPSEAEMPSREIRMQVDNNSYW